MINYPGDPMGNDPRDIWARNLMRFLRHYLVVDISNAKRKPQSNGGVIYEVLTQPARNSRAGGFKGEYDPAKSYSAGETFLISSATTISTVAVIAGFYGVPPGGKDVNGLLWAGSVPASPTGNAVPQSPLPTLGAAPNDKFYAKLIMPSCL